MTFAITGHDGIPTDLPPRSDCHTVQIMTFNSTTYVINRETIKITTAEQPIGPGKVVILNQVGKEWHIVSADC